MTDSNIRTAVDAWLANPTAAEATYGHISTWETGGVTDMEDLFEDASSFNEDIGEWDISGVTTMEDIVVTPEVSHAPMSSLKDVFLLNNDDMSVTRDVSHLEIWPYVASAAVASASHSATAVRMLVSFIG